MTLLDRINLHALQSPDRPAVIHHQAGGRVKLLDFSRLAAASDELAGRLAGAGLGSGMMAGVFMGRSAEHVTALLGIMKTGAAFFSINPKMSAFQVSYMVNLARAPVLLVDGPGLIRLARLPEAMPETRVVYAGEEPLKPFQRAILKQLDGCEDPAGLETLGDLARRFEETSQGPGLHPALCLFTSGSTGKPKGVMISLDDLTGRVEAEIKAYGITTRDRLLNVLPFSFDVGLNQLFTALCSGAGLVVLNSWLPADICRAASQHQVTGLSGVPLVWTELLDQKPEGLKDFFNSLRYLTVSGGDLPPKRLMELGSLAGQTAIYKTYGQTETFRSTMLLPHEFQAKMTSVGRVVPDARVYILDPGGQPVKPGQIGQIVHGGLGTMMGYLGQADLPDGKMEADPFGESRDSSNSVVFTGDMGLIDEDGYLYLAGRLDKMIKFRGHRIYPDEILLQVMAHPEVVEACIFHLKPPEREGRIVAEVRTGRESNLTPDVLGEFLSGRLPSYMMPAKIILVDFFPRTSSGKIKISEVEAKYQPL